MLQLKRFTYDGIEARKINDPVAVDERLKIDVDGERCSFELRGIVQHRGPTVDAGHYTAWVKYRKNADYFWFCDGRPDGSEEFFNAVPTKEALKAQPYLLLYKREEK